MPSSNQPGRSPLQIPAKMLPAPRDVSGRAPERLQLVAYVTRWWRRDSPRQVPQAWATRHVVPHPLPGCPALCKLDCSATEVLGPPSLSTCPTVRHPQPRPGRRVREESSPPTYYAWMQTGRAYSVFPSGRSRLQASPRRRLLAPRGCPARLGSRAARPGTVRAGLKKHCWSFGVSLSRPNGDRQALRLEAGNRASAVPLEARRPTAGGFPSGLAQAAAPDPARGSCGQGARSFGGIV